MNESSPKPTTLEMVTPLVKAEALLSVSQRRMRVFFEHEAEGKFSKEHEKTEAFCLKMATDLVDDKYKIVFGEVPTTPDFQSARLVRVSEEFEKLMFERMDGYVNEKGVLPPSLDL